MEMENTNEMRNKMKTNIFTVLVQRTNRDNKNNYCDEHARERAKVIEDSLFNNCCKVNSNWVELYNDINASELVDRIEAKTTKCLYDPNRALIIKKIDD